MSERRIVHRIEDGMDRRDVEATTYQMRNFYSQMRDGFFSTLDVFNYAQHHFIATKVVRNGDRVLDLCCGRGLMLPLLRFYAEPSAYVGVDIEPKNAQFLTKRVTDGKPIEDGAPGDSGRVGYYDFPVSFVESNVADLAPLRAAHPEPFQTIIYTSSIEHMHPDAGRQSLAEARSVVAKGGRIVVTGPNTPEGQDGYDTRYRAHVYEWKRRELRDALTETGWSVVSEWGLNVGVRELQEAADRRGMGSFVKTLRSYVPKEWLVPVLAPIFPDESSEIAMLAVPA
jgi:SAM-dependent methyltransferase